MSAATDPGRSAAWPHLTPPPWDDTRDTLHLWTQIVGKVRLGLTPMINHWWQVPLYVSPRGLTTSLMHAGDRGVEIEFDFIDHPRTCAPPTAATATLALEPRSVASFYAEPRWRRSTSSASTSIFARPSEVVDAIPFDQDELHRAYDADAAHRFWLLARPGSPGADRIPSALHRQGQPRALLLGGADLATTRFSGRRAPKHPGGVPNCPDWVQEMAYSHEVSSCGYWPSGSDEGSFYAYAYPQPDGFPDWQVDRPPPTTTTSSASSCCPTPRCAPRPTRTRRCWRSSRPRTKPPPSSAGWDRASLEVAPSFSHR